MAAVSKFLKAFKADESGATAIEYGLILGLMAIAIVSAITSTGTAVSGAFTKVDADIQANMVP